MGKAYLILENGKKYEGQAFGKTGTSVGELVFTTGMTGCVESLTDPSYFGQLVIFTFPMFCNYGVTDADMESSSIHVRGAVVREVCDEPSNFRCQENIQSFMERMGIVGISGVDTRELTQLIRDGGVMNAVITDDADYDWHSLKSYRVEGSVPATSTKVMEELLPKGEVRRTVALMDYGAKGSIPENLLKRGCRVLVLPHDTKAEDVLKLRVDGVMLSNGPGDPADNVECVREIGNLMGRVPLFGICLGHQMMALSQGGKTVKLKFGHRGANQPVKDLETGRVYITCQNHGYAVDMGCLDAIGAKARFINVNDGTCEGLDYPGKRAFSMQFHPEAHGGPRDTEWAFDRFMDMMEVR